ncbi:CU044_2847 family protein [Glycomyces sp. NPDC048151]|uniref:CU044_2847 family protein n=1 Tax=Glycomyces sp. NPDC048151 TaxID=3364002 RepID=UPI00371FABC8
MSTRIVTMPLESGGSVDIEITDNSEAFIEPVGRVADATATTVRTLRKAFSEITPAVEEVVEQLRGTPSKPDRIAIQFGVKITGETTAILAKAAAEANFTITAEWQRSSIEQPPLS